MSLINGVSTEMTSDSDQVIPEASDSYVSTPYIDAIVERALMYLHSGYPVHIAGPSGTGKTTLAFHLAALWGQPVTLIHGNAEFDTSDLIGSDNSGFNRSKLVDNYIHSVVKTQEEMRKVWVDNRLTTACRNGDTLLYDEFNRSRPETNNVLLSVLSEGILNLPGLRSAGEGYLTVSPNFRAIFTSNPEEYAGTHKTQDALMDRLITLRLDHPDRNTELKVICAKSGLEEKEATYVVDTVRELRSYHDHQVRPSLRAGIAIARILHQAGHKPRCGDHFFHHVCYDVLSMETAKIQHESCSVFNKMVNQIIAQVCPPLSVKTNRSKQGGASSTKKTLTTQVKKVMGDT
ncbi:gas vesicle protein GvpN [Zooshikella harenae]|uniref:Gas vesicle protein GvpN n=1 Tax=Zooshikella harenae TaxID=2827238 RepID=A0ABS5ZDA3_9GAMM|nr:gas vesicle protein GvpN [Zooshikella harenae]MBU2712037.1 gas vesicle protein GvpN [Zooshikella harenae]